MNKTRNFPLNQWDKTDRIMMEDFNADNAKIDAQLGALAAAAAEHTAALPKLGNCHIYALTYTGTGTQCSANPTSLTFPEKPSLVLVFDTTGMRLLLVQGVTSAYALTPGSIQQVVSWSGNSVNWYSTITGADIQFNKRGSRYYAFGVCIRG